MFSLTVKIPSCTCTPPKRSCAMASEQQILPRKLQIYSVANTGVSPYKREKYEREAQRYWDAFYKRHQNKFFKDRHYLEKDWGHYFSGERGKVILEVNRKWKTLYDHGDGTTPESFLCSEIYEDHVGCGAGNTIFPMIASYPDAFVFACDFSARAIDLVKSHENYNESCASAFISDLTADDLSEEISPSSVDIVTMIFMLSAVSPEKMPLVLQNIRKVMKPNGYVLFRDYAAGDLAQEKFSSRGQKISDNFYVRGDGTRAYYFSTEFLTNLFKENGFDVEEIGVYCKKVENRSKEVVMHRRWLRAAFRMPNGSNQISASGPDCPESVSPFPCNCKRV